ncbi:MAG: PPOX class F420-dependent oxidoreductase [Acidimicrobiia bacterium]|nr:PPOX class F420-dependent oxidoreductase [Acidimicrobiia bacterium]
MNQKTIDLASGKNFAVITTLLPDGRAQSHVMWVDTDGEHILMNTEKHRRKFRNIERDPRVTVTLIDRTDPYSFVEVRGDVVETVLGDDARAHIDTLSQKYHGHDYAGTIKSERVMLKIRPEREVVH